MEQRNHKNKPVESRHFATKFERMDGENRGVKGTASTFDIEYDMGWYFEKIEAGAFDEAMKTSDCRALFNHDKNLLLARQSSGTLTLSADVTALNYEFDSPETSTGNDILVMMERGDLKESSFAFTIKKQRWEEVKQEDGRWKYYRVIEEVESLIDVSPVTFPANPDTSVAKRSFDGWEERTPIVQNTKTTPLAVYERELNLM
jgi:HK97 family phage prohead protease